jgi:hypothetical protein
MSTKTLPEAAYFQRLRVLGAWWRLGSSALEPRLLAESPALDESDAVDVPLAAHGGVAETA